METSMTREEVDWIELKSDPSMPSKQFAWRQKLSDMAKQKVNLIVNVYRETHSSMESRMREIRTSGLMRGSNVMGKTFALLSTLLVNDG